MMAFERFEPFGALAADFRTGQVAAVVANVHRNEESRPEPFTPADFMPALHAAQERARPPATLLDDPEAQSALFDRIVFGKTSA